jgi:SEFIR domain
LCLGHPVTPPRVHHVAADSAKPTKGFSQGFSRCKIPFVRSPLLADGRWFLPNDTGTVFISYSHDSPDHARAVLSLSNRLRSEGIDCVLDQYESSPPEGWPRWMEREIGKAEFVLMICTEPYYRRVMGQETPGLGLGIAWEGTLIYNHIYNNTSLNTKFIPVIFEALHAKYIPVPLQGATRYRLYDEYEKLYSRLIGKPPAEKPPLGKRKPLPEREVKTDVAMLLSHPVDTDLWNQANWRATVFGLPQNGIDLPTLGLGFANETAARQIFQDWRERYGPRDEFEELRVSIIEGEIPGLGPGYAVHVGANVENVFKRYKQLGFVTDGDLIVVSSRINRMAAPNSPKLTAFKNAYRAAKTYFLAPAVVDESGTKVLKMIFDMGISKGQIYFRNVSEIGENDPDRVVLGKA